MMRWNFLISLIVFAGVGCGPGRPHLRTLELNREGNAALQGQTFPTATGKYLEALRYDPFAGPLHLNLGLSFEGQQQPDNAGQSYKEAEMLAEKTADAQLQYMAIFNQAQLLGKQKKVDEAIALYQKALDLVPTSQEAKNNIELLTQQQAGGGEGKDQENKDDQKKDGKDSKDSKDQKDPKDPKDEKDQKDEKKPDDKDDKDKEKPQEPKASPKYKPRPFDGKELSEHDVKKILGELKQQEEKIRAEYNKSGKEQPRDKDW